MKKKSLIGFRVFGILALLIAFAVMLDVVITMLNPRVVYSGFSLIWALLLMFGFALTGVFLISKSLCSKTGKIRLMKTVWYASFGVYVFALLAVLFGNSVFVRNFSTTETVGIKERLYQINLIPLRMIGEYIVVLFKGEISRTSAAMNLLGNFIMFMPMAVFLPYLLRNTRISSTIVLLVALVVIEIMQLLTGRGSLDVDDIILNFSGFCCVILIRKIPVVQRGEERVKKYLCKLIS